jgi:hypothetical protein
VKPLKKINHQPCPTGVVGDCHWGKIIDVRQVSRVTALDGDLSIFNDGFKPGDGFRRKGRKYGDTECSTLQSAGDPEALKALHENRLMRNTHG